nr:putative ribonuclease H-like domain-containing protein [Tanacetum cinerariifolium]
MIPEPSDADRDVLVNEAIHEQNDEELTEKELKQVEVDDQAIQAVLLGLPEDIYAVVDNYETAQEIWLRVHQMMKGSDIGIQEKKAKLFNEWKGLLPLTGNQYSLHKLCALRQDSRMQASTSGTQTDKAPVYDSDGSAEVMGESVKQYVRQNVRNQVAQNAVQNPSVQSPGVQNVGNQNGLIVVSGIANQNPNRNGNVVAARAKGNAIGNNAKYVRDFKSIAKEADESLAKHKALELEIERLLRAVVSEQKDTTKGMSVNTRFRKQSVLGKPPPSSGSKLYSVTPFPKSKGLDNTAKTKRPQPRSNTKNDRVPSVSKNSCSKNKEVEVEEHPRNLLLYKNKKHMSSECNNVKLAIHNDKSEFVYAMYSRCSKHMTGNLKLLINFIWKFSGTVQFGNDHVAAILGYDDLQWRYILITRVYFVKSFGHNLFSVGNDLVIGLPKFKYHKEHLCTLCKKGKSKRASHPPKPVPNSKKRLHLLHMDFCGLVRVKSINGKWYILVIVDYYSRYTWVHFLRSKDEAQEEIKTFIKKITILLQASVIVVRTDNDTEFKNQVLQEYFNNVGISHQASSIKTPQQNRVVERRNHTAVEAARTILIFYRAPLFLWAEAIATACYTQNCSIIHRQFDKTPYELINGKKPDILFLMYLGLFVITRMIMKTLGNWYKSPGLDLTYAPSTITAQQPTEGELELLFEAMYDDYISGQMSATA